MTRPAALRFSTRAAWLVLTVCLVVAIVVSTLQVSEATLIPAALVYACALLPIILLTTTWLMIVYRRFFESWTGWSMPIVLLIVSSIPVGQSPLSAILVNSSLIAMWAIGVATTILLWRRDVSLPLFAYATIVFFWILVIAWRLQGNLLELWIQAVNHPGEVSNLWWLNPFWCVAAWVIPLSLIGTVGHTARLVWREFRS